MFVVTERFIVCSFYYRRNLVEIRYNDKCYSGYYPHVLTRPYFVWPIGGVETLAEAIKDGKECVDYEIESLDESNYMVEETYRNHDIVIVQEPNDAECLPDDMFYSIVYTPGNKKYHSGDLSGGEEDRGYTLQAAKAFIDSLYE